MTNKEQCGHCGGIATVVRKDHRINEMGLPVVLKEIEVVECSPCGLEEPIIPNITGLMNALAWAVIQKPCDLSGQEFRFLRKFADLNAEEMGKMLHLDKTSVSKIETGQRPMGDQTDRLIRMVVLSLTPAFHERSQELVKMFPTISDCSADIMQELTIDMKTLHPTYAA